MKKCNECKAEIKRKDSRVCKKCKKEFCLRHIYSYVDGNNEAITRNSPELCKECYLKAY